MLVDAIHGYLALHYPSLASYAGQMEAVGVFDDIDPRLFAAIAVGENGTGTNNPFGLGGNGSGTFTSIGAAISQLGRTLGKYINTWHETTVAMLWSGNTWKVDPKKKWITTQPPGYCVGKTAAEKAACHNTGVSISGFMQSMGGNPNKLNFPCDD